MFRIDSLRLFEPITLFGKMADSIAFSEARTPNEPFIILNSTHAELSAAAADLHAMCDQLGMRLTALSIDRLKSHLDSEKDWEMRPVKLGADVLEGIPLFSARKQMLLTYMQQITERVRDELNVLTLLHIPAENIKYFEPAEPLLGPLVAAQFPSVGFEIDEAGKCLAVGRGTACIFHLMRVMEVAIGSIAKCLGIPDPIWPQEKNWGAIARTIDAEIKKRTKAAPQQWNDRKDRDFFDEIYVLMDAVRNVWRNATMHPDKKHTPEEAGAIFAAVRTFMSKIAERLDENGMPQA